MSRTLIGILILVEGLYLGRFCNLLYLCVLSDEPPAPQDPLCEVHRGWVLADCLGAWAGTGNSCEYFIAVALNFNVSVTLKCQCIMSLPREG